MIFRFLWLCFKLILQRLFHKNFQNMLYLSLFPGSYYESICTIAKLHFHWLTSPCRRTDIFWYNPVTSCCKHRWTEEAKTKVYIFILKTFTNRFFKVCVFKGAQRLALENQLLPVRVWLLTMWIGEVSVPMSKCLRSWWKWLRGVKEIAWDLQLY